MSKVLFSALLLWPLAGLGQFYSPRLDPALLVWGLGNTSEGRLELEKVAAASRNVEGGIPLAVVSFQAIDPQNNQLAVQYELVPDNGISLNDIRGVNSDDEVIDGAHSVSLVYSVPDTEFRVVATLPIRGDDGPFSQDIDFLRGDVGFTLPGTGSQFSGKLLIREPADQTALVGFLRAGPIRNELSVSAVEYAATPPAFGNVNQIDEGIGQITEFAGHPFLSLSFKGTAQPAYLFVWTSFGSVGDDSNLTSIQARFADASGAALGDQFQVNAITAGNQLGPRVAVASNNDFVVVWASDASSGDDNSLGSIQARLFNADGTPKGAEFQVNQDIMGSQFQPDVAMADDGSFTVVWTDIPLTTSNVFIRDFAADGSALTNQIQVNTDPGADSPRVILADGSLVVAWRQGGNVFRRGYFERVFASGFEAG